MNKNINNAPLKTKQRRLLLTDKLFIETELDLIKNIPEIQKNIDLKKLIFNSETNFPLIKGHSNLSKKSIFNRFNHKTEINNLKKIDQLYIDGSTSDRKPLIKMKNLLPSTSCSTKILLSEKNTKNKNEIKIFDNINIKPKRLELEDIKDKRIVAKSTKSIFLKNNISKFPNNRPFKKTRSNIENNYNKNPDLKINSEEIPFVYSKRYENTIFNHIRQINEYNHQKSLDVVPPENDAYNFAVKKKLMTRKNILLNLLKSEQAKLHSNYKSYSQRIKNNKKILEKDEKEFEDLKERQKNLSKDFENLYSKIFQKNKELIEDEHENKYIIKENQDEIRRILHKIDKLRAYGYFVNEVLGGDIKRFEKKIIPEDKFDEEINYPKVSQETLSKYNYCLLNSKFDDGNINYNKEILEQEKTFIYEPEKMWFKFKEIENIIGRMVFTKEKIKSEIKVMIEEKDYNLKDLKQRKEILEDDLKKYKENYEYEKIKLNEVNKRYNYEKFEMGEMIKDLYKYSSQSFNKIVSSNLNFDMDDTLDITKEIYRIIKKTEIYIDGLILGLKKIQTEDSNIFDKILDNRKKYLKMVKTQNILNQKMKEKFSFIYNTENSNRIILKSRKTEAPYHKPKKIIKEEIDKSLIERLENEELLTYGKEDDVE